MALMVCNRSVENVVENGTDEKREKVLREINRILTTILEGSGSHFMRMRPAENVTDEEVTADED